MDFAMFFNRMEKKYYTNFSAPMVGYQVITDGAMRCIPLTLVVRNLVGGTEPPSFTCAFTEPFVIAKIK